MNGRRVMFKRHFLLFAFIAACLIAGAGIWRISLPPGRQSKNALTEREMSLIEDWRLRECAPSDAAAMKTAPFEIVVDKHEASLKSLRIENTSDKAIGGFWVYQEGSPNVHDALTIVETVTAGCATDREKVEALFKLFPRFYDNFYPASDGGLLYEPSVLLAVFGWGQCNIASHNLETLCQLAGFETRGVGLQTPGTTFAHKTMEVFYDDAWHYLDPDGRVFFTLADGRIASVEDLIANPDLIRQGPAPLGYDRENYAAAFEQGGIDIFEYPEKFRMAQRQRDPAHYAHYRHLMRYDLLPRTSFQFERDNRSLFYSERREMGPPPSYANGAMRTIVRGDKPAVWQPFIVDDALILPVVSPYILVGAHIEGTTESPLHIACLPFKKAPLYTDEWTDLGTVEGRFNLDFSERILEQPIFGYALKITPQLTDMPDSSIEIISDFQHNPKALPQLSEGTNTFCLYAPEERLLKSVTAGDVPIVESSDGLRITFDVE